MLTVMTIIPLKIMMVYLMMRRYIRKHLYLMDIKLYLYMQRIHIILNVAVASDFAEIPQHDKVLMYCVHMDDNEVMASMRYD